MERKTNNKIVSVLIVSAVLAGGVLLFMLTRDDPRENFSEIFIPENVNDTSRSSVNEEFAPGVSPVVVLPEEENQEEENQEEKPVGEVEDLPSEKPEKKEKVQTGETSVISTAAESLSDEEVFEKLFPAYYLDAVNYYQEELVNLGYLRLEDCLVLDSTDNLIEVLDRELTYLLDTKDIGQQEYNRLRKGLHGDFLTLTDWDFEQLKNPSATIPPPVLEGNLDEEQLLGCSCGCDYKDYGNFWSLVAGKLENVLTNFAEQSIWGRSTYALEVCVEGVPGFCYRSGPPIPAGVNLWAPCCCCRRHHKRVGCLNKVCPRPHSAIWDPMTGICGCG